MFFPYFFNYLLATPLFTTTDNRPPTIYSLLNSIVNFNKSEDEQVKIKDLAKEGRTTFFSFDYPLSTHIDKEKFETMILNHYMMRRIGFETFTAFQIQLNVKLNEIMPLYNKMFDAFENWDIFKDGEITNRYGDEKRTNTTTNTLENKSNTNTNSTSDRRESDTPQSELENIRDGSYVTKYNYDTDTNTSSDTSNSKGNSNSNDTNNYNETIEKSPADKMQIIKEMQENIKSIYTLIFKDLDCLFFGLV